MPLYEIRSYKAPPIRGHAPIALEPPDVEREIDVEVGVYHDFKRGAVYEKAMQTFAGDVTPIDEAGVMAVATRLFGNKDCWHITINEYAKDASGKELRGTPHWCASVKQVQTWLDAG